MIDRNIKFEGTVPEYYDRHLGPVIFEPFAAEMATRVAAVAPNGPVLEIACGTGILTKHLRSKLLNTAKLVATDLNQSMIDIAFQKEGLASGVEWKQADCCALPFPDRTFAAVVNQFGFMFVPDKTAAIREAERVLKDGGFFAFSVFESFEQNAIGKTGHKTISSFFESDPPTFYQVPFGFSDVPMWTDMLTKNGFGQIQVHKISLDVRSESAESLAKGMIYGNPIALAIEERGLDPNPILEALTKELIRIGGDHPFSYPMRAIVFTARANA
jgi:ubiquinone/menaquinone biosynthesis C-methylase UbiE